MEKAEEGQSRGAHKKEILHPRARTSSSGADSESVLRRYANLFANAGRRCSRGSADRLTPLGGGAAVSPKSSPNNEPKAADYFRSLSFCL